MASKKNRGLVKSLMFPVAVLAVVFDGLNRYRSSGNMVGCGVVEKYIGADKWTISPCSGHNGFHMFVERNWTMHTDGPAALRDLDDRISRLASRRVPPHVSVGTEAYRLMAEELSGYRQELKNLQAERKALLAEMANAGQSEFLLSFASIDADFEFGVEFPVSAVVRQEDRALKVPEEEEVAPADKPTPMLDWLAAYVANTSASSAPVRPFSVLPVLDDALEALAAEVEHIAALGKLPPVPEFPDDVEPAPDVALWTGHCYVISSSYKAPEVEESPSPEATPPSSPAETPSDPPKEGEGGSGEGESKPADTEEDGA